MIKNFTFIIFLLIAGVAMASTLDQALQPIVGKWIRPDSGATVEIVRISPGGQLEANYYNPSLVKLTKAEASLSGEQINIFIEVLYVEHPFPNYHLAYDPQSDQLKGDYYEATDGKHYQVLFDRLK